MTHTPGPWEYVDKHVDTGHGFDRRFQFVRAPGTIIKNNRGPDYAREIFSDEDYPEKVDDGHLIAAAPDLLAALKDARDYLVFEGIGDAERIEAAIAKAEGRA